MCWSPLSDQGRISPVRARRCDLRATLKKNYMFAGRGSFATLAAIRRAPSRENAKLRQQLKGLATRRTPSKGTRSGLGVVYPRLRLLRVERPGAEGAGGGRPTWPNAQHVVMRRANSMRRLCDVVHRIMPCATALATWQYSPQFFSPHPSSATSPLIAALALLRNRHRRASAHRCRSRQSRRR